MRAHVTVRATRYGSKAAFDAGKTLQLHPRTQTVTMGKAVLLHVHPPMTPVAWSTAAVTVQGGDPMSAPPPTHIHTHHTHTPHTHHTHHHHHHHHHHHTHIHTHIRARARARARTHTYLDPTGEGRPIGSSRALPLDGMLADRRQLSVCNVHVKRVQSAHGCVLCSHGVQQGVF